MATSGSIVVSGSYFVPGTAIGSASYGAITGSLFLGLSHALTTVSGTQFLSLNQTGSYGAITASLHAADAYGVQIFETGATTFFIMGGFYVAGSTKERWIAAGAPTTIPPSGHALVDIEVEGMWTQ